MTISYDIQTKKWTLENKTKKELKEVNYPNTNYYLNVYMTRGVVTSANISTYQDPKATKSGAVTGPLEANLWDRVGGDVQNVAFRGANSNGYIYQAMEKYIREASGVKDAYDVAANNDKINKEIIEPYNTEVDKYNNSIPTIKSVIGSTQGGDYVQQRDTLRKLGIDGLEEQFKNFYRTEKLQTWDTALGSKPPYGDFDPDYYKTSNPTVAADWQKYVDNDDIDVTERYGEEGFYLSHYTNTGKASGLRGNAAEEKEHVNQYIEKKPTDDDIQAVRDKQLGVDNQSYVDRIIGIPEVAAEWEKAKEGDEYWSQLAKENYLDPSEKDEFVVLFRLSDRDQDKQVNLAYNVNAGASTGITDLEDAINEAVGEKAIIDVKKFGALTQNVLKDAVAKIKEAKAKEAMFDIFGGLGTFSEIMGVNETISNSLLGDTGIGGMLGFISNKDVSEDLETSLSKLTGVGNAVSYNWQKWFDDELKTKYSTDLELGYTVDEVEKKVQIDADFAKEFINKYLVPRFDTSRSMDEFVEYLDVRQEEQNPFQTQDMLNAVTQVAQLRAQAYLDELKRTDDKYFDPDFYFNPTGNTYLEKDYTTQAETVAKDWEDAKNGDEYWASQAYRYGVDLNDKAAFAKLHYQVKGFKEGYDGAKDILTAGAVNSYIFSDILPALKDEALESATVFGQFITPDEFADEVLKGVDPNDNEQMKEILERYGLTDFKGTIDDLKDYIKEVLQTGSATRIRQEIKYLNERNKKPTQKRLGLTYIEREEDYKSGEAKTETALYKMFRDAGYKGDEDEFYEELFPDVDRSEQEMLTKAGTGEKFSFSGFDFSDPYAQLSSVSSLFPEDDEDVFTTTKKSTGFFSLDSDDEEEYIPNYKSKSGEQILGEFTSFFK
jgi:hypothetical protein